MTLGAEKISLHLHLDEGMVSEVDIRSDRTAMAARMLEQKSTAKATALLPLLFSLCGTSQLQAGLMAIEEATGVSPSPAHIAARKLLINAETVSETAMCLLVNWPKLAGLSDGLADVRDIRDLCTSFKIHLFEGGQNDRIGGAPLQVDMKSLRSHMIMLRARLDICIFDGAIDKFQTLCDARSYQEWLVANDSLPAQCLKAWQDYALNWPAPKMIPTLDRTFLSKQLDQDNAEAFIARPTCNNTCYETGPYARQINHPLVKSLPQSQGRLVARLIDLAEALDEMDKAIEALSIDQTPFHTKPTHKGLGQVEAVRGQLIHRVWLDSENDIIQRYRILAPTEWNFHPDGVLKQTLLGMDGSDKNHLEQYAKLAITTLDPCVGFEIKIEDAC
ncbi:nickel-dependent hydrogenase large subunit [Terasakiella sp. A23]|uniref:nickel-dependent hydrogenase large subunit n=1 Tax=Terasakiella sp. FCG-A23 TaxID=3080561 RepID=UPI00295389A5|nr:nickel-dependent hydrogenase large subunit [Terasakiella sp. A23]MDV7338306.1 nickel-dependent hydrogenase large subunit [Terasakiella sp. A23]